MFRTNFKGVLIVAFCAAALSASAQSSFRDLMDTASATMDAARESREQNAAAADIRAIFAKAKEAEDDGNVNFCGFYVGMSKSDADALVGHYGLKYGEWSFFGDPVYSIHFSLKGVRRITKGGNSYEELCQAVANRVGSMRSKSNWQGDAREEWYEYKTIDGVRVTMAEARQPNANIDAAFNMVDTTGSIRKAAERQAAKVRAKEIGSLPEAKAAAESILAGMVQIPGRGYKMGKTEVTQAQWKAIVGGNPSRFEGDDNPVENVSWDDCQRFLSLLNSIPVVRDSGLTFRLPLDAEWEYACRAGATGKYCLLSDGTEITKESLGQVAWFEDNSDKKTHPVGQKQPNAFGLYDMHGNVWEWCQEEIGVVDSWRKGRDSEHDRVNRGGSCCDSARRCESSYRGWDSPSNRLGILGFRLCGSGRAD